MSIIDNKLSLTGGGPAGFQDVHIGNVGDGGVGQTVVWTSQITHLGAQDAIIDDKSGGGTDTYWLHRTG